MNPSFGKSGVWKPWHRALVGGMTIAALCLTFASEARAACVSKDANPGPSVAAPKARFTAPHAATSTGGASAESHNSIVGLWNVTFLLGSGPDVYDLGFQHNAYEGAYVADSYDLSGNVIPELHAEGVVRGSRITVR